MDDSLQLVGEAWLIKHKSDIHLDSALRITEVEAFLLSSGVAIHGLDVGIDVVGHLVPAESPVILSIGDHVILDVTLTVLVATIVAQIHVVAKVNESGDDLFLLTEPARSRAAFAVLEHYRSFGAVHLALDPDVEERVDVAIIGRHFKALPGVAWIFR